MEEGGVVELTIDGTLVEGLQLLDTKVAPTLEEELEEAVEGGGRSLQAPMLAALSDLMWAAGRRREARELRVPTFTDDERRDLLGRSWAIIRSLLPYRELDRETAQPIPIAELHCPWTDGAEATYERSVEDADSAQFDISIIGPVGAGGTVSASAELTTRITTMGECGIIYAHGDIVTLRWFLPRAHSFLEWKRIENLGNDFSFLPLEQGGPHDCGFTHFEARRAEVKKLLEGTDLTLDDLHLHCLPSSKQKTGSVKKSMEAERAFRFSLPGLKIETSCRKGVLRSHDLQGPGRFIGSHEDDTSAVLRWTWNADASDCRGGIFG